MSSTRQSRRPLTALPIRWRLLLVVAIPMIGVVVALSIVQYRQQLGSVKHALARQTHMTIQSLSRDLEKIILLDEREAISDLVDRLDSLRSIRYVLAYNRSGRPVFTYQRDRVGPRITPDNVGVGDVVVVYETIHNQAGEFGAVHVGVSREPLRQARTDAIWWTAVTIGAMLLVSLLLAYWLQFSVSRPITALSTFVRSVADSESYDGARADIDDRAELGALKDGINHLLDCIVERERSLRDTIIAVETANEARSEFVSHMNHEMRTPLNVIIGYCQLLLDEDERDDERDDRSALTADIKQIYAAAEQLLHLINGLLDLSKIEAGHMEVHRESVDVGPLITTLASQVRPLIAQRENRLCVNVPDDLGHAVLDRVKFRQCLLNLLSNAAKFTERGTITLTASRSQGEGDGPEFLTVRVRDTGIGMTGDQMARVFQPFSQATHTTSERFGGTGLGLAICKQYCEMMGGSITVDSAVGEGATFTIALPTAG